MNCIKVGTNFRVSYDQRTVDIDGFVASQFLEDCDATPEDLAALDRGESITLYKPFNLATYYV